MVRERRDFHGRVIAVLVELISCQMSLYVYLDL